MFLFLVPTLATAATVFVDANIVICSASGPGTSAGNPFCLIQQGICDATSGDTVSVAPGTYAESLRMKSGVSVVSQAAAATTIIDASGQPCTESDYCGKRTGQCSAILLGSTLTPATVLDGFTIQGGSGVDQPSIERVAGGGMYITGSPTIINNIITGNVIAGPGKKFTGAGIQVAGGQAVITGNVIEGNLAVPAPGTSQNNLTYGYGGGVYVGFYGSVNLTSNIIRNNQAGDDTLANSVGGGGGIQVFPGNFGTPMDTIDRNLITGNSSDTFGGGVGISVFTGSAGVTVVTSNVIEGNDSLLGGGLYTYFSTTQITNNTVTGNEGKLGGGMTIGHSDSSYITTITNDIVDSNTLRIGGVGGGIYFFDTDGTADVTVEANDLWGNQTNQVFGALTEGAVIGFNDNFSADPLYVNRALADFHLDANSPAIDTGHAGPAPALDLDGNPRGVDGDGTPDSPQSGDVDIGAFEFAPSCVPATEICDGMDNNCNSLVDEGFPDTDSDTLADCVDPDDDNDTVLDGSDCAPLNATAFGVPLEVTNLTLGAPSTDISFDTQSIGSGTYYEIVSGLVSRLRLLGSFEENFCLAPTVTSLPWTDVRSASPMADGWFYLARCANACGDSTFGTVLRDDTRPGGVCQSSIVDDDGDGSPSDLDCDDMSAARSPLLPEICDGIDNDCNTVVDDAPDTDGDSLGNCVDTDDDNDGVDDGPDPKPLDPFVCSDTDNDLCDDCSVGVDGFGPLADGDPSNDGTDTDSDGVCNVGDPDDDGDGVLDGADCAPFTSTVYGMPSAVQGLVVGSGGPTPIQWTEQDLGPATVYDLISGNITGTGGIPFGSAACLATVSTSPTDDSRILPLAGQVYYYLVKSRNLCGPGTFGNLDRDTAPSCP